MGFKITERAVPKRQVHDSKGSRWPFADLARGQCIEQECAGEKETRQFRSAASYAAKKYGMTITVRRIEGALYGAFRVA